MKKKILLTTILFMTIFVGLISAKAIQVSKSLNPTGERKPVIYDAATGNKINFKYPNNYYIFRSTNNNPVFCLDPYTQIYTAGPYKSGPYSGNVCGIIKGLTDPEDVDGDGVVDELSLDDLNLIKANATAGTSKAYINTYKKVQNYLWRYLKYSDCDSSIKEVISTDSKSHFVLIYGSNKLTCDDNGCKSGLIRVYYNYSNYSIKFPDGVEFIDENNQKINMSCDNCEDQFFMAIKGYAYIPAEKSDLINSIIEKGKFDISITGTYHGDEYNIITPTVSEYRTSGYQKIGTVNYSVEKVQETNSKSWSRTIYVSEEKDITIYKTDSETDEPLKGAVFGLYSDSNCTAKVSDATTNKDGLITFSGITGDAYVKELQAPANYNIDNAACTRVNPDESGYTIDELQVPGTYKFTNTVNRGNIQVKKIDSQTSEALAGFKFTLYSDSSCKKSIKTLKTGTNGLVTFENLKYGKNYYVKETYAEDGYDIDDKSCKKVELGKTEPYVFKDTPIVEEVPPIKISKRDIASEEEIAGAKMIIISSYKDFEPIEFESTDKPYEVVLKALPENYYYYLIETLSPKGYGELETAFKFIINEYGEPELISIGRFEKDKDGLETFKDISGESNDFKVEGDTIIVYNTIAVGVPDTGRKVLITSIIGVLLIGLGGFAIYSVIKRKKAMTI